MTVIVANSAGSAYLSGLFGAFDRSQTRVATGKFVLSAADDSTRYRLSETLLSRTRKIDRINTHIATVLGRLEATDNSLKALIRMAEQGLALALDAQTLVPTFYRGITSEVAISRGTLVSTPVGAQLSITSDAGKTFLYTINRPNTSWGDIADALNATGIGVRAEFVPGYALGQSFLRFVSSNDRDFRFDGNTDETVMDDLVGPAFISPGTGQVLANVAQANSYFGAAGVTTAMETGFTVGYGGARVGTTLITAATPIAAASSLVFSDGGGTMRSLSYPAGTTAAQLVSDINNIAVGTVAELVNQGGGGLQFRMRNTQGGSLVIHAATGDFTTTGALGFAPATGGLVVQPSRNLAIVGNNILTNGSFESGFLGAGSVPTGWTDLGTGPIGLDNTPGRVSDGLQYLPFGGFSVATGGAIEQVMSTVPGVQYTVQYDVMHDSWTTRPGSLRVQIRDGALTLLDSTTNLAPGLTPYATRSHTFIATSTSATIRLTDTSPGGAGDNDVDVDDVRVYTQGRDPGDNSGRLALGHQFDQLRSSMANIIAQNGGAPDCNLLAGHNIRLCLDEFDKSSVLITGQALSVSGSLGLIQTGATWYTQAAIQTSVLQSRSAIAKLRDLQERLATFTSYIKDRGAILESAGYDFKANGHDLVGADMAEESAVMTAIKTRMDFAGQSLLASNQSQQGLLRLLG